MNIEEKMKKIYEKQSPCEDAAKNKEELEWLDKMRKCHKLDTEGGHIEADDILCELVKKYCPFGESIVNEYELIQKWYA